MTDFRQNFLADSINNLNILQKRSAEDFTEELRREIFRTIHTIKGGAQTFGQKNAAKLAEKLENILSSGENFQDKDHQNLLFEGIDKLVDSLLDDETAPDTEFFEQLRKVDQTTDKSEVLLTQISQKVFKSFSQTEQNALVSALRRKENVFCVQARFESSNFAAEYLAVRKSLEEKGNILAALPFEKTGSANELGFRFFLTTTANIETLQNILENRNAEIFSQNCADFSSNDLAAMFSQIAALAKKLAGNSGKQIELTILTNDAKISAETVKSLFDILLHLVRNAVDHAIEKSGKIDICLFDEKGDLFLSVADNGSGIDPAKVRARAVAKKLISDDDLLDETETLELIFASELSTAETVTETSGRGVGLDAVKNLIEKRNGKISVKNRNTNGTIFEIYLPKKDI